MLETAADGIMTTDDEGTVLTVNLTAERMFGYDAAEMVGQPIKVLMPDTYQSTYDHYLAERRADGPRTIAATCRDGEGRRKNGSTFPLELSVGEAAVGGRTVFTGIVRDVTDRKKAEENLRHSEERFRLIIENVRDYAIAWLDLDGRIVSWNEGGGRIYGWSAAEIIGKHTDVLYPPELKAEGALSLQEVRESGRYENEGWRSRRDGSRFWAHAVITPLWDADGAMRGFVRVSHDITERKRVEANLQAAKEEADRAREEAERAKEEAERAKEEAERAKEEAERAKDEAEQAREEADRAREEADRAREEADRAKEEAERANFAKSKFLAAASHDLRQPVQAMVFFTEALGNKVGDGTPSVLVGNMKAALGALGTLLESLLDVSRLDAGVVTPKEASFSLAELLGRLVTDLKPSAEEKGLTLKSVPTSAMVRTDATLLGRVVQNLLSNAVKYTNSGRILIGCRRQGARIRVEVWDTGIGIPPDRIKDVFQEFYQVGNSERDRAQGLGLGLAIVQRLTLLLGARLSVRSVEGKGSVFSVDMPLVGFDRLRNVAYLHGAAVCEPRQGKPVVFIIDDELAVLASLRIVIENWGYDVLTATAEDEAVELLSHQPQPPDIIIADYRLRAGRTGAQAINRIWEFFARKIPSIIITGDTAPERIREAEAHGLTILHKPMQPARMKAIIADIIH